MQAGVLLQDWQYLYAGTERRHVQLQCLQAETAVLVRYQATLG